MKSALRPRKEPSSSDLQYLSRKNMWNTKSRPAGGHWVVVFVGSTSRCEKKQCGMEQSRSLWDLRTKVML